MQGSSAQYWFFKKLFDSQFSDIQIGNNDHDLKEDQEDYTCKLLGAVPETQYSGSINFFFPLFSTFIGDQSRLAQFLE